MWETIFSNLGGIPKKYENLKLNKNLCVENSLKFHNRQVLMLWVVVVCNLLLPGFHKFRFSLKTPRSWGLEQIPITSDSFSPANWNIISYLTDQKVNAFVQNKTSVYSTYSYLKALGYISNNLFVTSKKKETTNSPNHNLNCCKMSFKTFEMKKQVLKYFLKQ